MPILLLLASIAGAGGFLIAKSLNSKEFEAKKAYADCVKELTKKGVNPQKASRLCLYTNNTLDTAKLLLLTASVSITLLAVNFIIGRRNHNEAKHRSSQTV